MNRSFLATLVASICFSFTHPTSAVIRDGGIDPANLGKGDWVYYLSALTSGMGGNVPSVTNIASFMAYEKSQGIRYIIVKAASGSELYPSDAAPQFTTSLVNAAHAAGLLIFGYNRSGQGGVNVAGEVAVADYVFNQGADGFVWDAESEWEVQNVPDNLNLAWQICGQTRTNWPNKFLAHAPFDIISYHSSFPYKEFGYWSDAVMPQIYHFGRVNIARSPSGNINWADANWRNWQNGLTGIWTNSIKPLAPVNHVYGPNPPNSGVSHIPDVQVGQFVDHLTADIHSVTAGGYKGASFWRADLHGAEQWAFIKEATIGDFPGIVNNIVIDNASAGRVGSWTSVRIFDNGTYYGTTETNTFGTNYFYKAQGSGTAYVQYIPNVIVPGNYDVYEWHPNVASNLTASVGVPHVINYNGGSTTVYANQQVNAGRWNKLGRFDFAVGTSGNIRVADNSEAGSVVMSDGIKLIFVPPTSAPTAPSGLTAATVSSSQINLGWNDNATNESNFIVGRSTVSGGPYADIAMLSANSTNFSSTNLSANTTYYFVVKATNSLGASSNSAQASATTLSGVPIAPVISAQPQSQTAIAGGNATFSVSASATPSPGYQWRFNSADILGATSSAYTRFNVQTNHAGSYSVIVSNVLGSTNSASAILTVNYSLTASATGGSIAKSPDQSSYAPGSTVALTATPNPNFIFTGWSGDASGTNNQINIMLTTNKTVTANFVTLDLILDNLDSGVTFSGDWQTGTGAGKFNSDYRFAVTTAEGASNVIFRPNIGLPGYYDVYIWFPQGGNRATNAPWTVVHHAGSTNILVNQQINGAQWFLIAAARPFLQGTNGYVQLSNNASPTVVLADAVRFVYVSAFAPAPAQFQWIKRLSDGRMDLLISGGAGVSYWIDRTTNFIDWNPLTNISSTNGSIEFIDNSATNFERGFYRTRE
ncbi:MAG: immunoglobulin domain-containing protein [Verrucomicrobiota bacterium]